MILHSLLWEWRRRKRELRMKVKGLIFSIIFIANINRKLMNSRPGSWDAGYLHPRKEAWIINNPLQSSQPPSPPQGSHQERQSQLMEELFSTFHANWSFSASRFCLVASSGSSWFPKLQERTFSPFQPQISHPVLASLKVQNSKEVWPSVSACVFHSAHWSWKVIIAEESSVLPRPQTSIHTGT